MPLKFARIAMIVSLNPNAKPLCDVHHAAMIFTVFTAPNIQMTIPAFCCSQEKCTRVYQHGLGYHNITVGGGVSFKSQVRKDCPHCGATMYLAHLSSETATWRCGQLHCDFEETVRRS